MSFVLRQDSISAVPNRAHYLTCIAELITKKTANSRFGYSSRNC